LCTFFKMPPCYEPTTKYRTYMDTCAQFSVSALCVTVNQPDACTTDEFGHVALCKQWLMVNSARAFAVFSILLASAALPCSVLFLAGRSEHTTRRVSMALYISAGKLGHRFLFDSLCCMTAFSCSDPCVLPLTCLLVFRSFGRLPDFCASLSCIVISYHLNKTSRSIATLRLLQLHVLDLSTVGTAALSLTLFGAFKDNQKATYELGVGFAVRLASINFQLHFACNCVKPCETAPRWNLLVRRPAAV
jgi:hypothetical protein